MIHDIALYVGYAVLGVGAAVGTLALLGAGAWWVAQKVVEHLWSMEMFWQACFKILEERKAADRNQLTKFPPKDKAYDE